MTACTVCLKTNVYLNIWHGSLKVTTAQNIWVVIKIILKQNMWTK